MIPIYNEQEAIPHLRRELTAFLPSLHCETEVILVNDGSADASLALLAEWAQAEPNVKVIHLSRNFGHQIAATAGLDHASGDAVVLIDADLQDPPAAIPEMIARYSEGYDIVYGQRESRQGETLFKRATAWGFYRLMRAAVHKDLPVDTGDFRLMSRRAVQALSLLRERHRFLRGMVAWMGFPQTAVRYQRQPRVAGRTKYPLHKMLKFAWTAATSFSSIPLKASLLLGVLIGVFGLEEAVRALLAHFLGWYAVPGWTSLMVITSLIGSSLLISVGVLGEYIGKIYEECKERPLYLVARTFNVTGEEKASAAAAGAETAGGEPTRVR